MEIEFLGATGTVTGSKYALRSQGKQVLVDCGLFQGLKELRLRNWSPFPLAPSAVNAVLLTHAHLDHSGCLPLLCKQGYVGPIYSSPATEELARILLPDSGFLQEEEARFANKRGFSKHKPALALYTEADAVASLSHFRAQIFHQPLELPGGLRARFHRAGHILGASMIHVSNEGRSILFSGDLGRLNDPVMRAPEAPPEADYLVIESTYGNRVHPKVDPIEELGDIVRRTVKRGGVVVIPAFAVGRAQNLLYFLHRLKREQRISDVPVFLNSPMATAATTVFCEHLDEHRLDPQVCREMHESVRIVRDVEGSKAIATYRPPFIVISASGMATGGRVLHHIKSFAGDARNTILFTGYQAAGTRGAAMVGGAKEVKIHGEMHAVRAEVINLENTSAHADAEEVLKWLGQARRPFKKVFITHGEADAAAALRNKIQEKFGWPSVVPAYRESFPLT